MYILHIYFYIEIDLLGVGYFLIAKSIYDHTIIFLFQGKYYKKDTAIHSLHTVVLQH